MSYLFPVFTTPENLRENVDLEYLAKVFTSTYPASGEDIAKLVFWSFVAGFSERLVPQVITGIEKNAFSENLPAGKDKR